MDELTSFLHWFLKTPVATLTPLPKELIVLDGIVALVLFRSGQFQVELIIPRPGSESWPEEHCHPDVDQYQVKLVGDNRVTKNGTAVTNPDLILPVNITPEVTRHCLCVRLTPSDFHGADGSENGGAFLSVQHWLNGVKPTSVGKNWQGKPSTGGHEELLRAEGSKFIAA